MHEGRILDASPLKNTDHAALFERRTDKAGEQRVWLKRARLQFRVELHADEPGMVRYSTISGRTPSGDRPENFRPLASSCSR